MHKCNTNCVEKPLSKGFGKLGHVVGKYPWMFLILPVILSAGLGAGFYFLEDREENGIEEQFTPKNGPAKAERAFIQELFPQSAEFSSLRLHTEGTFASVIAVHSTDILNRNAFEEIIQLDHKIKQIRADDSNETFLDMCAQTKGECVLNQILNFMNASINDDIPLSFPWHDREFIGTVIGGVRKNSNNTIESAQAIRLFYYLTEDKKNETDLWLKKFIETFSKDANNNTVRKET